MKENCNTDRTDSDSDWTKLGLLRIRLESDESDRNLIGLVGECKVLGSMLDLYIGYGERALAESLQDYTTFQSPFGALCLTTLPMGWTNSVPIFHDDVTFILQAETPQVTIPYIDDIPVRGPAD